MSMDVYTNPQIYQFYDRTLGMGFLINLLIKLQNEQVFWDIMTNNLFLMGL